MSDYPGAIPYYVDRSRVFQNQNSHKAIVCHGTGGSASQTVEQLGDYFRTNALFTSVHCGIGRDGRIAQYVLESDGAAGNCCVDGSYDRFWDQFPGNKNLHTLSFETINDSANSLPLTDPQKLTTFKLIKYWVDKYHIPIANIKSHASLDPINRSRCPGPNFPWQELFNYLTTGGTMSGIPSGWKDANGVLTAPNNIQVARGFRDYVLNTGWDSNDYPLTPEYGANPVEQSNTALGGGTAQDFRMTRLCYTAGKGVYKSWIGQELAWHRKAATQLAGQVTQLKTESADLREQFASGQTIPQAVRDDILVLAGNVAKLKTDAGVQP